MRVVYIVIGLALVGAIAAIFYLKNSAGSPLMSVDDLLDDHAPESLDRSNEIYRWQDEEGIWQFGDHPPDPLTAERVEIRPNITPIKADWVAQVKERRAAEEAPRKAPDAPSHTASMPGLGDVYDGQALQKAKDAAGQMEGQTEQLEALMKSIRQ